MMKFNFPIFLTLSRIIIVPFFVLIFYLPQTASIYCTIIFTLASLTDWLDGFLARKWKQTTKFGAILDPIADKIIVITTLILIIEYFHIWYITLSSTIIIIREIIISIIRTWMIIYSTRTIILMSTVSKLKTSLQMFALIALLCRQNIIIEKIGINLLHTATILTLLSMLQYFYIVWRNIVNH
ncbi:MAG: phosphatidylglycerophosphate synthase [Candidatus Westeberhardia cardiocondylae]|nr:phosphatidylglycerophosphate synthase [Candidatus Westeberhardia cardiocondylae]